MKKIIFMLCLVFCFYLFSNEDDINVKFTKNQIENLKLANYWGSQYKTNDGHKFNDTLMAIILTESSAGKNLIGDNFNSDGIEHLFIEKSLGLGQIKLETAIHVILNNKYIFEDYLKYTHKNPYAYKKYSKIIHNIIYFKKLYKKYSKRIKENIGDQNRNKKVLKWVKRELKNNYKKYNKIKNYYKKDLQLAQLLVSDKDLNLVIAVNYLIENYNVALKRHYENPYFKTISRYNGGWNNKTYYKRVIKNMKIVRYFKNKYL